MSRDRISPGMKGGVWIVRLYGRAFLSLRKENSKKKIKEIKTKER